MEKKRTAKMPCEGCGKMVITRGTGNFFIKAWHVKCLKKAEAKGLI